MDTYIKRSYTGFKRVVEDNVIGLSIGYEDEEDGLVITSDENKFNITNTFRYCAL